VHTCGYYNMLNDTKPPQAGFTFAEGQRCSATSQEVNVLPASSTSGVTAKTRTTVLGSSMQEETRRGMWMSKGVAKAEIRCSSRKHRNGPHGPRRRHHLLYNVHLLPCPSSCHCPTIPSSSATTAWPQMSTPTAAPQMPACS